ncbi:MAG: DUF5343 domain-containing protein, partial [Terracidiphilus sp.]
MITGCSSGHSHLKFSHESHSFPEGRSKSGLVIIVSLAESYTLKPNAIPAYFDAMLDAQPPERFSLKFLENLGFTSTNDRLFIGILKDLGFLNSDGVPQSRYFQFLDRSIAKQVLAAGSR